ncbi:uncharacterized protein [Parasteatoda tepidariorum]|uniref:uncharacterized protein isoform X2 n=1 Tax=Parasteatoda tepidariorum TaxID=114398 RepID=UPI0039BD47DA
MLWFLKILINFVECKNYPFKVYGIYGDHHGKRHHHGRHAYTPPPKKVTTHKPAVKHRGLLGGLFGGIGGLANGIVRGVKNVVGEVLPPLRPITDRKYLQILSLKNSYNQAIPDLKNERKRKKFCFYFSMILQLIINLKFFCKRLIAL